MRILTDRPIETSDQDKLSISEFVSRLVPPILDWPIEESLVLGLYGEWGQGKTSALNLLRQELLRRQQDSSRPVPVIVRFNPWHYSNPEALAASFFGTMAGEIGSGWFGHRRRSLARAVRGIGAALPVTMAASGSGFARGSPAGGLALLSSLLETGEAGLDVIKQKARKQLLALKDHGRRLRVVVLVDDLDRAQPREVLAALMLFKLIADLPNVSYVLAMDDRRVRDVLATALPESGGAAYLDKIVQVPVQLPPVAAETLKQLVKASLLDVLEEAGLPSERINARTEFSFGDWYDETLAGRIKTMRDRAILVNSLRFALLSGKRLDLDPIDAVLTAFLQAFFPSEYRRVRANREFLTCDEGVAAHIADLGKKSEQRKEKRKAILRSIVRGEPEGTKDQGGHDLAPTIVEKVVGRLFPRAEFGERPSGAADLEVRLGNRVQHPETFDRYFRLSVPDTEVPDATVDQFLTELVSTGDSSLFGRIAALPTEGSRRSFVEKLGVRVALAVPADAALRVAEAILKSQDALPIEEIPALTHRLAVRAFLGAIKEPGTNEAERSASAAAVPIIRATVEAWYPPLEALHLAADYARDRNSDIRIDGEAKSEVVAAGLGRIRRHVAGGAQLLAELPIGEAMNAIWRWRDLLELAHEDMLELQFYLRKALADNQNVVTLCKGLSGPSEHGGYTFASGANRAEFVAAVDGIVGSQVLLDEVRRVIAGASILSDVEKRLLFEAEGYLSSGRV
jgi:hypothetical protein